MWPPKQQLQPEAFPRGNTTGKLPQEALEAFKLMANRARFVGSSTSKNVFPQFSKFIALSKLGTHACAKEMLPSSKYRKSLCELKMTSSWQCIDVSIQREPFRPGPKQTVEYWGDGLFGKVLTAQA